MDERKWRGSKGCGEAARYICSGPLVIDLQNRFATLNDAVLPIPPCTFDYLVKLAQYSPDPVSYRKLAQGATSQQMDPIDTRDLVRLHIYLLRKALDENTFKQVNILAEDGFGYKLVL